jgi:hypothetical protein
MLLIKEENKSYNSLSVVYFKNAFSHEIDYPELMKILGDEQKTQSLKESIDTAHEKGYHLNPNGTCRLDEMGNHWYMHGCIQDWWVLDGDWDSIISEVKEICLLQEIIS